MDWNEAIENYNRDVPMNFQVNDEGLFSYDSTLGTAVYGKWFRPMIDAKKGIILLYHGLGAHTATQGYQEIASSWNDLGFHVLGMDVRHQGGKTKGEPHPHPKGLYLSGYESMETYYYRQVYLDAYRLVDVGRYLFPGMPIYATGGSQGGALALFVGMFHDAVTLVMADMPSCVDIPALIHHSDGGFRAFLSTPSILDAKTQGILWTVDLLNFAEKMKKPTLLASGDQDRICPLEHTNCLFDRLNCEKKLIIYPSYGHGGYDYLHHQEKLAWIEQFGIL